MCQTQFVWALGQHLISCSSSYAAEGHHRYARQGERVQQVILCQAERWLKEFIHIHAYNYINICI